VRIEPKSAILVRCSVAVGAGMVLLGSWLMVRGPGEPGVDRLGFELLALPTSRSVTDAAQIVVTAAKILLGLAGLALVGLLVKCRQWRGCAVVVGGALIGQASAHLAKTAIARPRPVHELVTAGGYSFPSTTSALGMSFLFLAIAVARLLPQRRRRATVAAGAAVVLALGLSFLALRVHYATDVIAGWALGALAFTLCELIAIVALDRLRPLRRDHRYEVTESGRHKH
jgi:membrane-associated phospholipid phosphatase